MSLNIIQRLVRRGDVFYFRRRVPKGYLSFFSFGAVVISLRTKDLTLALVRWSRVNQIVEQLFEMIDEQGNLDQDALKSYFHRELKRILGLDESVPFAVDPDLSVSLLDQKLANQDGELYDLGLEHVIGQKAFMPYREQISQNHYPQIGQLVAMVHKEALQQQLHRRKHGQFTPAFDEYFSQVLGSAQTSQNAAGMAVTGQVTNPSQSHHTVIQAAPDPSYSLNSIYDGFKAEEGSNWGKRHYKFDEAYRIMSDLYGADADIRSITVEHARQVKTLITQMPVRASQMEKYKNLPLKDQVALAKIDGDKVIAVGSIKDKLKNISLWFGWAKSNKFIKDNHFHGLSVKDQRSQANNRSPFTSTDLKTLFAAPRYTGMLSERKWMEQGRLITKNLDYWAPLIAIYSGMRLEEICQLHIKHLVQKDGIWIFDLMTDPSLKIKTRSSKRYVPIHKALLTNWKFEDWIKERVVKSKLDDMLFEGIKIRPDGTYSSAFSKRFGRFLDELNLHYDGRCFHSFRHNMTDALREARVEAPILKTIIGHDLGDVTSHYGNGYSVKILKSEIDKVKYEFKPPKI